MADAELASTAAAPKKAEGAALAGAIFNFINSIVGAGIIGLPFAISEAGIWLGLIMLVACGALTDYSVRLLVDTGVRVGKYDYEELCEHFLGRAGYIACSLFMFVFAMGAMMAYTVIIGDTVPTVLHAMHVLPEGMDPHDSGTRTWITLVCSIVVVLPLCLLKSMASLAKTSLISITADALITLLVLWSAGPTADTQGIPDLVQVASSTGLEGGGTYDFAHGGAFRAFGAMCFAYVCHHSSFIVRNSMIESGVEAKQWDLVTHISIGVATILSITLSLSGYLGFQACTRSNILNNLLITEFSANTGRALLACTMFFTFPMENFVARHALRGLIFPRVHGKSNGDDSEGGVQVEMQEKDTEEQLQEGLKSTLSSEAGEAHDEHRAHYPISLGLWGFATLCGLLLPQDALGVILDFSGGFSATCLGFILPALCFFRAEQADGVEIRPKTHWAPAALLVVGILAMLVSTFFTIQHAITCSQAVPDWCPINGTSIMPHTCPGDAVNLAHAAHANTSAASRHLNIGRLHG